MSNHGNMGSEEETLPFQMTVYNALHEKEITFLPLVNTVLPLSLLPRKSPGSRTSVKLCPATMKLSTPKSQVVWGEGIVRGPQSEGLAVSFVVSSGVCAKVGYLLTLLRSSRELLN